MLEKIAESIVPFIIFCVWIWIIAPSIQQRHNQRVQKQMEKDDLQKVQK